MVPAMNEPIAAVASACAARPALAILLPSSAVMIELDSPAQVVRRTPADFQRLFPGSGGALYGPAPPPGDGPPVGPAADRSSLWPHGHGREGRRTIWGGRADSGGWGRDPAHRGHRSTRPVTEPATSGTMPTRLTGTRSLKP